MGSIFSTIQLHHGVPQDVGTLQCWCPQSTACRWRSQFRQGRKLPMTWTPFVSSKHWVCKWDQPTRVCCEKSLLKIQFWRRSCVSREKVGHEKRRRWPSREIPKNHRLSVCHGCLLYGSWVVIPAKLRRQVLDLFHECHFGIQRMRQLARTAVYRPNIDSNILDLCRQCSTCAGHQSEPSEAAIHPRMLPEKPWSRLHIDHAINLLRLNWLVVTDAYTKYPCNAVSISEVNYHTLVRGFHAFRISSYSRNWLRCYLQIWRVPGVLQREWNCPSDWSSVPSKGAKVIAGGDKAPQQLHQFGKFLHDSVKLRLTNTCPHSIQKEIILVASKTLLFFPWQSFKTQEHLVQNALYFIRRR